MGLLVGLVVWLQGDDTTSARLPGDRPAGNVQAREQRLVQLLDELPARLQEGRLDEITTPAGASVWEDVASNVRSIGFERLDFRFVAPSASGVEVSAPGSERTWTAGVQVTWQFAGYDTAPAVLEVPLVVTDDGEQTRLEGVAAASPSGARVPSWLLERLLVRKGDRTLVLAARREGLAQLVRYAEAAVPVVNRVLPAWRDGLVVVVPSDAALLDRALGTTTAATGQLAGVTAAVDGSALAGAPLHVFLNPPVFDTLGPQAAQVVVTHEATHVATDGAFTSAPQWLVEGFADYVALRDIGLPVTVSAAQALEGVRQDGPPRFLPEPADFAGTSSGIGATYELAWLAARYLAQEFGEPRLLRLYDRLDGGAPLEASFRQVLGVTPEEFTAGWATAVAALASGT